MLLLRTDAAHPPWRPPVRQKTLIGPLDIGDTELQPRRSQGARRSDDGVGPLGRRQPTQKRPPPSAPYLRSIFLGAEGE